MMQELPGPLRELTEQLTELPGLGPKSALRTALTILKWPESKARELGRAILELRDKLCICQRCGCPADADPCTICSDPRRKEDMLLVTADWDGLLALEQGGFYEGRYLILGGLLAPLDGFDPEGLDTDRLRSRLQENVITEVVLALGTTLEAENTSSYVKNLIEREFSQVRVSRLAQGIPLGSEVKYMDKETLKQSLLHRQNM